MPPSTASSRKRAKLRNARNILVQHQDPAIQSAKLNVPDFLRARRFQIAQLQNAILKSRAAASKRAFQALPRALRRRSASHNVKRMPRRLRDKARHEMLASSSNHLPTRPPLDKLGLVKSKKLRGYLRVKHRIISQSRPRQPAPPTLHLATNSPAAPPPGKTLYAHRQRSKTWLPTHVWHAKRAHIAPRWSFAVPTHPSLKCYRATHRAASRPGSAIAWDASYTASLLLEATSAALLLKALACITLAKYPAASPQLLNGSRSWAGLAYDPSGAAIAPVLIVCSPATPKALLRCHPAASLRVMALLNHLRSVTPFSYHDWRYLLGSIDIAGPKSLPALAAILKLKPAAPYASQWAAISQISNSAALPSNVVIALEATDPRLSYPPHYPSTTSTTTSLVNWPDETLVNPQTPSVFDLEAIANSYKNKPSQKTIDKRRAASTSPRLPFLPSDPTFPVLLLKTGPSAWSAILPWGWVMPLWYSLHHLPGIRLGGSDQRHQLAFEAGALHFPTDYVGCSAALAAAELDARAARESWARKPAAKRVSYRRALISKPSSSSPQPKVRGEIGSPFRCDWKFLWTLHTAQSPPADPQDLERPADTVSEDALARAFLSESKTYAPQPSIQNPSALIDASLARENALVPHAYATFSNYAQSIATAPAPPSPLKPLLVTPVRIKCLARGTPRPCARIYRVPPDQLKLWLAAGPSANPPPCPDQSYLIGFVTSGAFNLAKASGTGVGAVASYIYDAEAAPKPSMLCLVRNVGSSVTRLARISQIPLV